MNFNGNESDSDDISLLSEDGESETLKRRSTGPKTWNEVDESKLHTLSSRLSQLILGTKSSQTLPTISSFQSSSENKPLSKPGGPQLIVNQGVEESLLNPDLDYATRLSILASLYEDVSWHDLVQDFELLRNEFTESADQMKSLIKDHFHYFIVIRDATNDILTRMTALEMEGDKLGVHGATATDVQDSIARLIQLSNDVFGATLQRNERKQNISRMLNALGQYDSLVTLPSQIRERAESEDFETVLILYRKAQSFVDGAAGNVEEPGSKQMWDKLRTEVNVAMAQAVDVLTSIIKDGDVDPSEAAEAVVMLKRLDDEGVPTAKGLDGVLMLLHAQTHSITEKIVAMKNDIIETIKAGERETIGDSGGSNFTDLTFGSASQFSYNIGEGSTALVLTVTAWMAELYKITNRSLEDSSINWRSQEEEFDRVLFSVFDTLEAEVMEIQSHLIKSNNWIVLVTDPKTVGLIKAMAEGYQLLIREGMPSVMVNYFSNIVSKLVMATWDKVEKTLCFAARASALSQPWTASPGCISKAAAQLRLILEDGLDCVLTIQKVCSFAVSQMSDLCILPMQTLCNVLACFADGIVEHAKQKVELDPSSRQTVRQLLYGWQVLETLISNTVPSITKDPDFVKSITTSGVAKADLLLSSCQDHVKASALGLIAVYLDQKLKEIDEIMESLIKFSLAELGTALHDRMQDVESLIQSWNLNCVPARANPSVWSLLTSIISVGSELAAVAEPLHNDVLSELLDRIGKGFEELIKSQVLDNMSSISLQQLWLDLKIFIEALSTLESKGVSLLSLQIFLSELESIVIQVVQSSELGQHWNQSGGDVRRWIERQCISEIITAKNLTG